MPSTSTWGRLRPVAFNLLAAEAVLDLLRLAVERDFAAGFVECRQESAAIAAGHALRLVHRARLAYAEALAAAISRRPAGPAGTI